MRIVVRMFESVNDFRMSMRMLVLSHRYTSPKEEHFQVQLRPKLLEKHCRSPGNRSPNLTVDVALEALDPVGENLKKAVHDPRPLLGSSCSATADLDYRIFRPGVWECKRECDGSRVGVLR